MASRLEDLVTQLAAAWVASGGATSVTFESGALRQAEHGGPERIIFIRQRGVLLPSTATDRVRPGGTAADYLWQTRSREETIAVELRFPTEEHLDDAFDRMIAVVESELGAKALESAGNTYSWWQADSTSGGSWEARSPALTFFLTAKLRARPLASGTLVSLTATGATAGWTSVPVGATAAEVVTWTQP